MSALSSSASSMLSRRRLLSAPSWLDFVVVVVLCMFMLCLLRVLKRMNENWKKMMKARIDAAIQLRKDAHDSFRSVNGYSWDYCMVFKIHPVTVKLSDVQNAKSLKVILTRLADAGLQTKLFYSVQRDEVYCKIRCPVKRLEREADRVNYKLLLEPTSLANKLQSGNMVGPKEKQWQGIQLAAHSELTSYDPYEYIYSDFRASEDQILYKRWPNNTIFRGVDRLKLIATIISARLDDGGGFLDVYRLMKDKCMIGFIPLHDAVELRELESKWLRFAQVPWKQSVDAVKDYFGEKTGLYYLFLGHYTIWLIYAGLMGFFAWCNVADTGNNPSAPIIPYFCAGIAVWSTLFLENWKRKEKTASMRWGTVGFEAEEQARPEFSGELEPSPITGQKELYFPRKEYLLRICISVAIISMLILIVLGVIGGIFVLRIVLTHMSALVVGEVQLGGTIAGLINAVQIQVLNAAYQSIAVKLNDFENHRTDTEYEDSLIAKTFIFQFVNSFASLFYIAFVKPYIAEYDPCLDSCMTELQTALGTIFLTNLATGSFLSVVIPYAMQRMRETAETKGVDKDDLTDCELQYIQENYDVLITPFKLYAGIAIQFGYATMFVAAYPLALPVAFISNYIEMRVGAWRMCQLYRRPEPRSVEDIGTWYTILEVVSAVAVVTNSGLVAFTGTTMLNHTYPARIGVFIVMIAIILFAKYVIAVYIPDVPEEVQMQLERNSHFVDKIVYSAPDDVSDDIKRIAMTKVSFAVRVNDDDPL